MKQYDFYGPEGTLGSLNANSPRDAAIKWKTQHQLKEGDEMIFGSIYAPPFYKYKIVRVDGRLHTSRVEKYTHDITRGMVNK